MLNDEALRESLAARAWERAVADFDIEAAREKFWKILEERVRASSRSGGSAHGGRRQK